jgi:hypothetical protein
MTPAGKNPPYLWRKNNRSTLTQYQLLCPGDVVVNPAGSGITIRYRLSGQRAAVLTPGAPELTVPDTSFQTQMAMLSDRAIFMFDYMAFRASGVRGSDESKSIYPLPDAAFAVPAWGPFVVAWADGSAGTATIQSGGQNKQVNGRGWLSIDLAKDCATSCTIQLSVPSVGIESTTKITTLSTSDARAKLAIRQFDEHAPRVAIASWFGASKQGPAWQWQQASILWNAGCDYPAFDFLAQEFHGLSYNPDTCIAALHE